MQLRLSTLTFRPFAALLILVALLMGSAIDAAACEPEFVAHAQVEVAVDGADEQGSDSDDQDHAVCAHGHCHHGTQILGGSGAAADAPAPASITFGSHPDGLAGTSIPLPKQPPRA